MSGRRDRVPEDAPPKTQPRTSPDLTEQDTITVPRNDEDAAEGWDNEGGHDRAHLAEE